MAEKVEKEEKKIEAVAKGHKAKKSGWKRFKESFIAEEAVDFKEYLVKDLIIPTIQDAIYNGIEGGLSMLFYGESGGSRSRRRDRDRRHRTSYSYRRDRDRDDDDRRDRRSSHSPYGFEEIECETKSEALEILDGMDDILDAYDQVSIADMYDLAGVTRNPEDNNYGWTMSDKDKFKIVHTRDGMYMLSMPRARVLK